VNPFEAVGTWLSQAVGWVLGLVVAIGPVWSTLVAAVGIFLETTLFIGLVVPGDTIVVTAATAVHDPVHFVALWLAVIVGTLAGQSVGFLLGRWAGPAIRRSRLGRRLGESTWDRAAALIERRGGVAVFVSRFLPVLHALMPVTVGMSPMPYRRFIKWASAAAVIWASAYVSAGALAGAVFRDLLLDNLHYAGYVFAAGIVVFALIAWLFKRRVARAAIPEALIPPPDPEELHPVGAVEDGDGRIDGDVRDESG